MIPALLSLFYGGLSFIAGFSGHQHLHGALIKWHCSLLKKNRKDGEYIALLEQRIAELEKENKALHVAVAGMSNAGKMAS